MVTVELSACLPNLVSYGQLQLGPEPLRKGLLSLGEHLTLKCTKVGFSNLPTESLSRDQFLPIPNFLDNASGKNLKSQPQEYVILSSENNIRK